MNPATVFAFITTIILAFIGYIATYINNFVITKRKERLELVNNRLNNFYGPLYVAVNVSKACVEGFFLKIGRSLLEDRVRPFSKTDKLEYVTWMQTVLIPLNERCEKILLENAYLIIEPEMPQCILDFITCSSGYKVLSANWQKGDYSDVFSVIPYPPDLGDYLATSYNQLKKEQLNLIEKLS
jgi:hypothetical protein